MGVSIYWRNGIAYGSIRWKGKRYPAVSLGTRDKVKAQREAARVEKSLEDGTFFQKAKKLTFEEFLGEYEKDYKSAPTPAEKASRATSWVGSAKYGLDAFFKFCREEHQIDRIDKITAEVAEDFPDYRTGECNVSAATANANIRVCKAAFNWAVSKKWLPENPFAKVAQSKLPSLTIHWLRQADAERYVAAALQTDYARESALYLYAGLRKREALYLRWDGPQPGVDFDANLIRVLNQPEHGFLTKSRQQRSIPMAPELRTLLLAWRQQDGGDGASGLVCGQGANREMKRSMTVTHALARIGKGLTPALKVSPQVLRRTFGSLLRMTGTPIDKISKYLGHSSIAVTERWYADMDVTGDDTYVQALSFQRVKPFGVVGEKPKDEGKAGEAKNVG